jgi:hypothetical protein
MNREQEEKWWITVHSAKRGPYPDQASAYAAASLAQKVNSNFHVAVVNPQGISTPVDG